ncbi:MAG: hypothetical protein J5614_08655 [Paludibacteraceae bacterium]|nr:hypothetical protein [Paludibacteraceae bacterium]
MLKDEWEALLRDQRGPICDHMYCFYIGKKIREQRGKLDEYIKQRDDVASQFGDEYTDRLNDKIRGTISEIAMLKALESRVHVLDEFVKHEIIEGFQLTFIGNGGGVFNDPCYGLLANEYSSAFWRPSTKVEKYVPKFKENMKQPNERGVNIIIARNDWSFARDYSGRFKIDFRFSDASHFTVCDATLSKKGLEFSEREDPTSSIMPIKRDEYEIALFFFMRKTIHEKLTKFFENTADDWWTISDDEFYHCKDDVMIEYNIKL